MSSSQHDWNEEEIGKESRITEIIPGKDGQEELVRMQTSQQEFLRPIQRIYPLEILFDNLSATIIPDDLERSNDISKILDCTSGSEPPPELSCRIVGSTFESLCRRTLSPGMEPACDRRLLLFVVAKMLTGQEFLEKQENGEITGSKFRAAGR
ncbi:hypothetical protein TNCV_1503061 [Trichonephila clavipes]|uniref:Uncharacterized protein n=1 Tax=Trichonephila clavipes TaxID=2585209 RepID=A0A8X6V491_TRICX|nr:hypothetical protein TNCV_1503061 [Trichonephila clavipes]